MTRGVEAAIDKMRPGLPGIDIDTTIFRPATFVEQSISNLTESLLIGGALVILVLLVFLFEWRVALISATIIPLSLMASLLVLNLRGVTINVMTLAGLAIAIGAVVDDVIVDVENIVRRLRQLRQAGSTLPTWRIVLDASIEVRGAIVYASLIEISALLPVFFLQGLSGAFFQPLASAYVYITTQSTLSRKIISARMPIWRPCCQKTIKLFTLFAKNTPAVLQKIQGVKESSEMPKNYDSSSGIKAIYVDPRTLYPSLICGFIHI